MKYTLQFAMVVVSWMVQAFTLVLPGYIGKLNYLVTSLIRVERTRGTIACLEYIKQVRLSLIHYLSGEYPIKKVTGIALTRDGIPKILGPMIEVVREKHSPTRLYMLRFVLTLLFSTRALNLGRIPDFSTITEPAKAVTVLQPCSVIEERSRSFWKELGYTRTGSIPRTLRWKKYHFTSKSGPNGHALWTSMNDFVNLSDSLRLSISYIGGKKLHDTMEMISKFNDFIPRWFSVRGKVLRKITWFPDRELKVRVVAIGDYWSQTALIPLHQYLFKVLRKIPQDCTFSQSSFLEKTKDWEVFYSIDLTAATDRFPISFICSTLKGNLPDEYVSHWANIMVGEPFSVKGGEPIHYSVGNPMGFYSSWNSFAVAHHFVVYNCCKDLGIEWKTARYCLLGDDIIIGDHHLAERYKQYILSLGVDFSPLKTHESTKLFEFAKRYVLNGEEITPFPISSLKESKKRFYLLVALFCEQVERGWVPLKGIPDTVSTFYKMVLRRNSTFCAIMRDRSYTCELIMKVMRGVLPANDALNSIARKFDIPVLEFSLSDSIEFLNGFLYESFIRSDPQFSDNQEPLGLLSENLLIQITGVTDEEMELGLPFFDLPPKIPILNIYGQIEESWLKMRKEAERLYDLTLKDWTIVQPMTIPLSDRVFVERQSHLVSRASAIMGDKLIPALKQLSESRYHLLSDNCDPEIWFKAEKAKLPD